MGCLQQIKMIIANLVAKRQKKHPNNLGTHTANKNFVDKMRS